MYLVPPSPPQTPFPAATFIAAQPDDATKKKVRKFAAAVCRHGQSIVLPPGQGAPRTVVTQRSLEAHSCLPIPGVRVPGKPEKGMLVGWSMSDAAFPYTLLDAVDDAMLAVLEVPAGSLDLVRAVARPRLCCFKPAARRRALQPANTTHFTQFTKVAVFVRVFFVCFRHRRPDL